MVTALGHISGGHFNPAVTLGFLITRRIEPKLAVVYWLEQFAGATLRRAAPLVDLPDAGDRSVAHRRAGAELGDRPGRRVRARGDPDLLPGAGRLRHRRRPARGVQGRRGFGIGLVVTMDILCGGPLTGAAMNPARAFGPELVANFWRSYTWIYYVGPAVGAVVAALLYELLFLREPLEPVGPKRTGVQEPRPGDLAES